MSDLRPHGVKLKLGKKEYGIRFTLNAIDEIQDHFDIPISRINELFEDQRKQITNLRWLLTTLINEDIDCLNDEREEKIPKVDERYVGRHIDSTNMKDIIGTIYKSFSESTPESDDEVPNDQSE